MASLNWHRLKKSLWFASAALVAVLPLPVGATTVQHKNDHGSTPLHQNLNDPDEFAPPQDPEQRKYEAARLALIKKVRDAARAEVAAASKSVVAPDTAKLATALKVDLPGAVEVDSEDATRSTLRVLGDLEGDGTPEVAFRWSRVERYKLADPDLGPVPAWVMFLLSFDGTQWQATELTSGGGISSVELFPGIFPKEAIIVVDGLTTQPFPVIFQYQDHHATLAWDSRADESHYQSYAQGEIYFQAREGGPPVLIVKGRADPGVLRFLPGGRRGFEAATAYFWEQGAYVPKRTEFEDNEDYTLYRFLAALHMRDFKAAFACIDPAKFLQGSARSPEALRKTIEASWPDFVGNSIFEAVEGSGDTSDRFAVSLERGNDRVLYLPAFSADGKLLLTGLERRRQKP